MQRTIDASATVKAAFGRVREVLVDDPGAALKEHVSADERRARRFHSVLSVGTGAGATLQQEVVIEVGAPRRDGEALAAFLAQMLKRLDVEVDRRLRSVPSRPVHEPISIEESGP